MTATASSPRVARSGMNHHDSSHGHSRTSASTPRSGPSAKPHDERYLGPVAQRRGQRAVGRGLVQRPADRDAEHVEPPLAGQLVLRLLGLARLRQAADGPGPQPGPEVGPGRRHRLPQRQRHVGPRGGPGRRQGREPGGQHGDAGTPSRSGAWASAVAASAVRVSSVRSTRSPSLCPQPRGWYRSTGTPAAASRRASSTSAPVVGPEVAQDRGADEDAQVAGRRRPAGGRRRTAARGPRRTPPPRPRPARRRPAGRPTAGSSCSRPQAVVWRTWAGG